MYTDLSRPLKQHNIRNNNEQSFAICCRDMYLLGITRDTVYKWINDKQFPAHRAGKLWKFKSSEVDAWVKLKSIKKNVNDKKKIIYRK